LKRSKSVDGAEPSMPDPKITPLESVLPWKYRSWVGTHYSSF